MNRLILLLGPVAASLGGVGLARTVAWALRQWRDEPTNEDKKKTTRGQGLTIRACHVAGWCWKCGVPVGNGRENVPTGHRPALVARCGGDRLERNGIPSIQTCEQSECKKYNLSFIFISTSVRLSQELVSQKSVLLRLNTIHIVLRRSSKIEGQRSRESNEGRAFWKALAGAAGRILWWIKGLAKYIGCKMRFYQPTLPFPAIYIYQPC